MDRNLLTAILITIKNLRPGEMCPLTIEEARVLEAFLSVRRTALGLSESERSLHKRIEAVLDAWRHAEPVHRTVERQGIFEQRTQVALRTAIDKVLQNRWQELSPDERRLLRGTRDVYARRNSISNQDRLLQLLIKVVKKLDDHQAQLRAAGAEGVREPISNGQQKSAPDRTKGESRQIRSDDLQGGQRTPMSLLEGIAVDLTVRLFEFDGDVAIDGDVQDDVLVYARRGGIVVNGFVAGNLVARDDIEVRGNVQGGMIISTHGSISVARALVRSRLIAKNGSIHCEHIEDAYCVFAWDTIDVTGTVLGGHVYGANIQVGEKVLSGELHSCGSIQAPCFEVGQRTAPIICLRKRLTCEDYGRSIDETISIRQKRVRQLVAQIELAEAGNRFAHQLIRGCFRTGLFYLVGGVESAQMVLDLQGLQTRSVYLRQLIGIAQKVVDYYGSVLEDGAIERDDAEVFRNETLRTLRGIRNTVDGLPVEFGPSHRLYLLDRCEQFRFLADQVHEKFTESQGDGSMRDLLHEMLKEWSRLLAECEGEIDGIIRQCNINPSVLDRLDGATEELEALLTESLAQRAASADKDVRKRAQSPLLRLLRDQVERYRKGIQLNEESIASAREELDATREALAEDAAVLYGDALPGDCSVESTAFGRGVIITASPGRFEGLDNHSAEVIVLSEDIQRPTMFRLNNRAIHRIE